MSEENKLPEGEGNLSEEETKAPVVYASPLKRVWAWVGVVYMVIIVFLLTYLFAYGAYLGGIGALMVCPALAGVAASAAVLWRQSANKTPVNRMVLAVIVGLCGGLVVWNLWTGIPSLLANFGVR